MSLPPVGVPTGPGWLPLGSLHAAGATSTDPGGATTATRSANRCPVNDLMAASAASCSVPPRPRVTRWMGLMVAS